MLVQLHSLCLRQCFIKYQPLLICKSFWGSVNILSKSQSKCHGTLCVVQRAERSVCCVCCLWKSCLCWNYLVTYGNCLVIKCSTDTSKANKINLPAVVRSPGVVIICQGWEQLTRWTFGSRHYPVLVLPNYFLVLSSSRSSRRKVGVDRKVLSFRNDWGRAAASVYSSPQQKLPNLAWSFRCSWDLYTTCT